MENNQVEFKQPIYTRLKVLLSNLRNSENKRGVFILLFLLLIIPLIIFVLNSKQIRDFLYRTKAAPNAALSLVPQGVSQNGQGRWQFTLNQNVNVNVVAQTGDAQIELSDFVINFDPTIVSFQSIICNPQSALRYSLTSKDPSVQIIKVVSTNLHQIQFACVAFDPPYPTDSPQFDPNWQRPIMVPILSNTIETIATAVFRPISLSTNANLSVEFAGVGNTNDTNLVSPLTPPGVFTTPGTDQLGSVTNATFDVVSVPVSSPTPTSPAASPTPARHGEGDANGDNAVDIQDFQIWRNEFLSATTSQADFNGDFASDIQDFQIWRNTFLAGG